MTFLTKFSQKSDAQSKRKKVNSTNELFIFCIQGISEWKQKKWTLPLNSAYSNYSSLTNFSLNRQFCFFWTKFTQKGYFWSKTEKWISPWLLHTRISVGIKFQLQVRILIFGPNFARTGISGLKQKNHAFAFIHDEYLLY